MNKEETLWLLKTIKQLHEDKKQREISHNKVDYYRIDKKIIFRGSYDVWSCKQDEIDAHNEPVRRLTEAENEGYIIRGNIGGIHRTEWTLTDKGKQFLEENGYNT